tara:strand:- start:345 stop:665 length:321 start_codon:yes stop_codon:yes gene_type:complete
MDAVMTVYSLNVSELLSNKDKAFLAQMVRFYENEEHGGWVVGPTLDQVELIEFESFSAFKKTERKLQELGLLESRAEPDPEHDDALIPLFRIPARSAGLVRRLTSL